MQTDVKYNSVETDDINASIVGKLDAVLFATGVTSVNAVISNARSKLSAAQSLQFDAVRD